MDSINQFFAIFKNDDKNDGKNVKNKDKSSGTTARDALRSLKLGGTSNPPSTDYDKLFEAASTLVDVLNDHIAHIKKYAGLVAYLALLKDFFDEADKSLSSLEDAKNAIAVLLNEKK